jgi:NAD+ diphosphatase
MRDETHYFAIDVSIHKSLSAHLETLGQFSPMRPNVFSLEEEGEAAIVACAKSLLEWNARHIYCSMCGAGTKSVDSGWMRECANVECKSRKGTENTVYPRTDPGNCMISNH